MTLTKADESVAYAYCQCPTGRVGTCSHVFALMKLVVKCVIDKINKTLETKTFTSKPCAWSIPQTRERLEQSPISSLNIFSPATTKSKINTCSKVVLLTILVVQIQAVPPIVIKASHHLFMILGLSRTEKMVKRH